MADVVGEKEVPLVEKQELFICTLFERSWATRRDGFSKGGCVLFVVTRSAEESGVPIPLGDHRMGNQDRLSCFSCFS